MTIWCAADDFQAVRWYPRPPPMWSNGGVHTLGVRKSHRLCHIGAARDPEAPPLPPPRWRLTERVSALLGCLRRIPTTTSTTLCRSKRRRWRLRAREQCRERGAPAACPCPPGVALQSGGTVCNCLCNAAKAYIQPHARASRASLLPLDHLNGWMAGRMPQFSPGALSTQAGRQTQKRKAKQPKVAAL